MVEAALKKRTKQFVIDGEAVILGVDGYSDFDALHSGRQVPAKADCFVSKIFPSAKADCFVRNFSPRWVGGNVPMLSPSRVAE